MNWKKLYKILIWTGFILFLVAVVADGQAIPYLSLGVKPGFYIFMLGVLIWLPIRIRKPITHPYNPKKYVSLMDAGIAFVFNNFLLEFWGSCVLFGMTILVIASSSMKSFKSFQAAQELIAKDSTVLENVGQISRYGDLIGGTVSTYSADINVSVYGDKGALRLKVNVKNDNGKWELENLTY